MRKLLPILALVFAAPTHAQQAISFEEAARINSTMALQFCLSPNAEGSARAQMFRQAGFAERVERSTINSDTTHWFSAPAETADVELYYGEMPQHCVVTSSHMGVTAASRVLDQVVPQFHPGFQRQIHYGPVNPSTGQPAECVSYVDPTNPIGLAIGVSPGAGGQGCVDNGTVVFFSTYRV